MSDGVSIRIPKLGLAMTEGTLVAWLVEDGSVVAPGDSIYTLETDKVESEVEAPAGGVIERSGVVGETYEVGDEVGRIRTSA